MIIGGNYNAYENERKNYELNNEIIRNANRKRKDEYDENEEDPIVKAEQMKLKYNTENLTLNYYKDNQIDPEPHWYKVRGNGKPPKPRAFQQCVYLSPYIFLFGGVELSAKSESISNDEFYALNIKTFEWKQIINNIGPYNRTEFKWIKIGEIWPIYMEEYQLQVLNIMMICGCLIMMEQIYLDLRIKNKLLLIIYGLK